MKKSKLKRVINKNKYSHEEGFYLITAAFNSHMYKEVYSFLGYYCDECNKYDLYKVYFKNNQYMCVYYNHTCYETEVFEIKDIDKFMLRKKVRKPM